MEENSTVTIIIAVIVFTSVAIFSLLMGTFVYMKDVITDVRNTDISIKTNYFDNYHNQVLTGMDLVNTLKQLEEEEEYSVELYYEGRNNILSQVTTSGGKTEAELLNELMKNENGYSYSQKYKVTVAKDETENYFKIIFTKI